MRHMQNGYVLITSKYKNITQLRIIEESLLATINLSV